MAADKLLGAAAGRRTRRGSRCTPPGNGCFFSPSLVQMLVSFSSERR